MRWSSRLLVTLFTLTLPASALATWSVIAVETSSGRVVIASATCVDRDDQFLKGVQAVVVPGKGVAACQAAVDNTHKNQMLVFTELQKGTDPQAIMALLGEDPAFQSRQFGILDLQGRSAGHSGLTNGYVSQDMQGRVPGTDIYYSIQGNILRPGQVVPNAVQAFLRSDGGITDRVMAAMEAADGSGGDSRCTCPPWPTDGSRPAIACDGRTAYVAYILMAEKQDTSGDSHNNGRYSLYLTTSQPGADKGPNQIRAGENLNPVRTLRMRYDAWRRAQASPVPGGRRGSAAGQSADAAAVAPAMVAPTTAPAPGAAPGTTMPPRGAPAGRRVPQVMTLSTTAWTDGGAIPVRYAQPGDEVSPPLAWDGVPEGTTSFVLLVRDIDQATAAGADDTLHWLVWNLPGAARALPEGVGHGPQLADGARQISATGPFYRGPGAPGAGPVHHYLFELFALDTTLDVPANLSPTETRAAVVAGMAGHVRGKAALVGSFKAGR